MRMFLLFTILAASALSFAAYAQQIPPEMQAQIQQLQNMPPQERDALMQSLMQNANAMQECVNKAGGEAELAELQALYTAHQQQITALCEKDKREQAQAYAQDAVRELMQDGRIVKLQQCSRMAMQNMPQFDALLHGQVSADGKHVCENIY